LPQPAMMTTPRATRRSLPTPLKAAELPSHGRRDWRRHSKPDPHSLSGTMRREGSASPEPPPQDAEARGLQKGSRSPTMKFRCLNKGGSSNEASTQTVLGAVTSLPILEAVEEEEDGPARLADVQQRLQEMQNRIVADVEQKLQEHGARWRAELAVEVARQLAAHLSIPERDETTRNSWSSASSLRHAEHLISGSYADSSQGSFKMLSEPAANSASRSDAAEQRQHGNVASGLHHQSSAGETLAESAEDALCPRTDLAMRFAAIERLLLRSKQQVGAAAAASMRDTGGAHDACGECDGDAPRQEPKTLTLDSDYPAASSAASLAAAAEAAASTLQFTPWGATSSGKDAGHRYPVLRVQPPHEWGGTSSEHPPQHLSNLASGAQLRTQRAASPELSDILERRRSISEGRLPCQKVLSPRDHEQRQQQQQQHAHENENDLETTGAAFHLGVSTEPLMP